MFQLQNAWGTEVPQKTMIKTVIVTDVEITAPTEQCQ